MLLAEELEADWSQVHVETPAFDPALLDQGTGGSTSVLQAFEPLRQIGAAMRMMLIAAAAARWKLPAGRLRAENGYVVEIGGARRASFGELVSDAAKLPVPARPRLKPRDQWKLLGEPQAGKDVADIVHGRARYGLDQRPPGMLFASIERPRELGATLDSFDAAAALAVSGVKRVIAIEPATPSLTMVEARVAGGVAVIASNTWAALEGRRRLTLRWKSGPHAGESTATYTRDMAAALDRPGAELVHRTGDPEAALAKATTVLRADYEVPFLAHATLEPMNCTAHWDGTRMTLWSPTQDPETARLAVATRLGLRLDQVVVHIPLLGGGFGRRLNADFSVEAALVARQLTAPVQVMWTREDDLGHDFYRPCARHRLEACLDERGFPRALRHRLCDPAIRVTYEGGAAKQLGRGEGNGIANAFYRVPHRASEYTLLASGVPRGWWRAVHTTHTTFALESFIDELAVAAGADPLAYRLALIEPPPVLSPPSGPEAVFAPQRMKDCLALAADRAGWGTPVPAGHARGIACSGFDHMSYAAMVIEASLAGRRVVVHRVVCAFDCGTVINPDGARAQVEGSIVQGLSAALHERITIDRGRVVETNFHRYALLRIDQAPAAIEVHFMARPEVPVTGLGEPALPPVAPALANALFRLTGQRLRTLPFALPA
jgi:isoquinoline 1-oxidoreductase subunit beta